MEKTFGIYPRSFQSGAISGPRYGRGRVPARLTSGDVISAIAARLRPIPPKAIAGATGSSVRAAENVKAGLNAMSLTNFLNACRAIPELRALAMQLMGCEAETDPEFLKGCRCS